MFIPEEALAKTDKTLRAPRDHELLRPAQDKEAEPRVTSGISWLTRHLECSSPPCLWLTGYFDALETIYTEKGHRFPLLPSEIRNVFCALGLGPEGSTRYADVWHLRRSRPSFNLHWHPAGIADWRAERDLVSGLPNRGITRKQLVDVICVIGGLFDPTTTDLRALEPRYGFDPFVTAPDAVTLVTTSYCVNEDAVRYFLQLLTLPGPMNRNVGAWSG